MVWSLTFTIVCGDLLEARTPGRWPYLLAAGALIGLAVDRVWTVWARRAGRIPAGRGRFREWPGRWFLGAAWVSAFLYGVWVGHRVPERVDGWCGVTLQAQASVEAVVGGRGGMGYHLRIGRIATAAGDERCDVDAVWFPAGRTAWAPGSALRLNGVLFPDPPKTPQGPLARPQYRFEGTAERVDGGRGFSRARGAILEDLEAAGGLDADTAALAVSMLVGGGTVAPDVEEAFLAAGLLHVLAASGANVVILERTFAWSLGRLWRWIRLPGWTQLAVWTAGLWGFAGLCAFSPSIVRACAMAHYRMWAEWFGRPVRVSTALAAAGLWMAVADPGQCRTLSGVLSFAATGAVASVAQVAAEPVAAGRPRWRALVHRVRRMAMATTLTACWVEAVLLPFSLCAFGQLAPYAPVSNAVMDPVLALSLPLVAIATGMGVAAEHIPALRPLAEGAGLLAAAAIHGIVHWAQWVRTWPGSLWRIPRCSWLWAVPYYTLLLLIAWRLSRGRRGAGGRWARAGRGRPPYGRRPPRMV
ncbi:ComEC/Rec2 family competence protein [Alicyclobacillus sp.]|uniref:ComEC/Rec2 family competence protein n=1 Tax=Alicyclobacillus sp. TaxID=61169 RepID=UPI0025C6C5D8|nr:ComEC/Rec2 family competence protein [Alicyclobacillus sp.]MCL6515981.1 ComEC/Rec2 family competence protein [Alicyclobacillus sp.]